MERSVPLNLFFSFLFLVCFMFYLFINFVCLLLLCVCAHCDLSAEGDRQLCEALTLPALHGD